MLNTESKYNNFVVFFAVFSPIYSIYLTGDLNIDSNQYLIYLNVCNSHLVTKKMIYDKYIIC